MLDVNWDDLRMLLAVFRAGSFSAGARALGLSHSTVSRRTAALEKSLGVKLLQRTPEGLLPTTAGERIRELAEQSEANLDATVRTITGGDQRLVGTVRLAIPDLAAYLLMPALGEFAERYPGVTLDLVAGRGHVDLLRGEAEVALRMTNRAPESAVGRRLGPLEMAMYVARESPHETPPYISTSNHLHVPRWYQARFPDARLGVRVNKFLPLLEAVRAGVGAGALPLCVANRMPDLRRVEGLPTYEFGVWALTHADLRETARVRVLLDWMAEVAPRLLSTSSDGEPEAEAQADKEQHTVGAAT